MSRPVQFDQWVERLQTFPSELTAVVANLPAVQLDTVTAADPWTIAQIVHHCADSHMNSFIRLKLVLSEDVPPLKGYNQDHWITMADENSSPVNPSLEILSGLHQRWVVLFQSVEDEEWQRYGQHSEGGSMTVTDLLSGYAQHCDDHLDQIHRIIAALPAKS